jgi:peptide deformylase
MALLPVIYVPDPRLKQVAKPVEKVDNDLRVFLDDLAETMYKEDGAGLAAPQVAVLKRIFVMDLRGCSDGRRQGTEAHPYANKMVHMINPEIIWASPACEVGPEGCISVPENYIDVSRPSEIKVKFLDYHGEEQIIEATHLLARCIQHEMDHLNGKTLMDYVSFVKKDAMLRKVNKYKRLYKVS